MVSAPRSRDWAAKLGVRDEVSEAALGYADRDRVRATYRRTRYLDERNTLMPARPNDADAVGESKSRRDVLHQPRFSKRSPERARREAKLQRLLATPDE